MENERYCSPSFSIFNFQFSIKMRNCFLYIPLLFLLVACGDAGNDDFIKVLPEKKTQITQVEFTSGAGDAVVSSVISKGSSGQWIVNGRRPVDEGRWTAWWTMLSDLRVYPLYLDATTLPGITSTLRSEGLHIIVRAGDEDILSDFYVARFDNIGIVALSGNNTRLIDLPYEETDMLSYCSAGINFWQDMTVFAALPADMDTIEVVHRADSSASFRLVRQDTSWSVTNLGGQQQRPVNRETLQRYLSYFRQVRADSLLLPENRLLEIMADSRHLQHIIRIAGRKSNVVQFFGIPLPGGEAYDTDKCLLYLENTRETALASWMNFDLLLKNLGDFVDKK